MAATPYDAWKSNPGPVDSATPSCGSFRREPVPRYRAPDTCERCDGYGGYFTSANGQRHRDQEHASDVYTATCPDCRGLGRQISEDRRDFAEEYARDRDEWIFNDD